MKFPMLRRYCIALLVLAGVAGNYALAAPAAKDATARPILVVGDSLSAEYGLPRGSGWVALLQKRLAQEKRTLAVVNASISGDTTSGGRSRLGALLAQHRPGIVILELGGNDALRGLPLAMTRDNLAAMTKAAQDSGARVLLLGMQMPPNYGRDYANQFSDTFASVARDYKVELVPFMLKGVADAANPTALFQPDRIHPVAAAHPIILDNVWPTLKKMLR